jgi:DNA-binding IclR family transcriptional regulator
MPILYGSGLSILAFLPEEESRALLDGAELEPLTDATVTDPGEMRRWLERIRRDGYACSVGQRIVGGVGVSAPIWGPRGEVMGNAMLALPAQRFRREQEPELASLVIDAAAEITRRIGGVRRSGEGVEPSQRGAATPHRF